MQRTSPSYSDTVAKTFYHLYNPFLGRSCDLELCSDSSDSEDSRVAAFQELNSAVASYTLQEDYAQSSEKRSEQLMAIQRFNEQFGESLNGYSQPAVFTPVSLKIRADGMESDRNDRLADTRETREGREQRSDTQQRQKEKAGLDTSEKKKKDTSSVTSARGLSGFVKSSKNVVVKRDALRRPA
jgi:hypothetical protein